MKKRKNEKHYVKTYSANEKLHALNLLKRATIEFVAHRYHCSVRTLYRWKSIYDGTLESLEPKYCAPYTPHPNRHTELEIKHIKNLIKRNPHIGLNELYGKLRLNYSYTRNPISLYRFLRKNGWYKPVKKQKKYIPKPYDTPKHLGIKWQLDVKFVPLNCFTQNKNNEYITRFYQYTVIDEATRERFIYPYMDLCADSTIDFIRRAIIYFGYKPKTIQTDNGSEFTYAQGSGKEHPFTNFCKNNGIEHKTIKPRTPRHNGKVERSHRNDNKRFYNFLSFYTFEDLLKQMKAYLHRSNNIPISTLKARNSNKGWLTPIEKRKELLYLDYGIIE